MQYIPSWTKKQKKTLIFADTSQQKKKVKFRKIFQGQIKNTFKSMLSVIKMAQNRDSYDEEDIIDANDMLISSLNLLAANCYDLNVEKDKDTLDLGRKQVFDLWQQLEKKDVNKYKMSLQYQKQFIAVLNSKRKIRYAERVEDEKEQEAFVNDPKLVNDAFVKLIGSKCAFEKEIDQYDDEHVNDNLKNQQSDELNTYHKDKKYNGMNRETQELHSSQLHFTERGQQSMFIDSNNDANNIMNQDLFGDNSDNSCDDNSCDDKPVWKNAYIKLNESNKKTLKMNRKYSNLKRLPCQILIGDKNYYCGKPKIKLAKPFDELYTNEYVCLFIDKFKIERDDTKKIAKVETNYCSQQKVKYLGYQDINGKCIDKDNDLDDIVCGVNNINMNGTDMDVENVEFMGI